MQKIKLFHCPIKMLCTRQSFAMRMLRHCFRIRNRNRPCRARNRCRIDTDQFIESEMPSKRPLCNKVGVPNAEVMQPHPNLPANHLSTRRREFEGG